MKATDTKTAKVAYERYEIGIGYPDPTPLLWAAEIASETIGKDKAYKEVKMINSVRRKNGKVQIYVGWNSIIFPR